MTRATAYSISKWILRMIPVTLIAWDVYVAINFGHTATLSHAMWEWSLNYPWFSFVIMLAAIILCWHFFVGQATKSKVYTAIGVPPKRGH